MKDKKISDNIVDKIADWYDKNITKPLHVDDEL